jgi:hypothetical protein
MHADKRGRLLTQPPRKTPDVSYPSNAWVFNTQKCMYFERWDIHKRPRSRNPNFSQDATLSSTPWSFPLTPRRTRDHCNGSFEISVSVDRNQSMENWIDLRYNKKKYWNPSHVHVMINSSAFVYIWPYLCATWLYSKPNISESATRSNVCPKSRAFGPPRSTLA